jgi:hypothetical protein
MPVECRAYLGLKLPFDAVPVCERSGAHKDILTIRFINVISYRVTGSREREPGIPSNTAGINTGAYGQDQIA